VDTLIFVKFGIIDTLEAYQHNYVYKVRSIFYSLSEFFYSLILSFTFIFYHAAVVLPSTVLNTEAILLLVVILAHPVFSRYTSMCVQGIKSANNSKRIRSAPKARLFALNMYVRWFWWHPAMMIFNLFAYGSTFFLYFVIYTVSARLVNYLENTDPASLPEPALQGCVLGLTILALIYTVFYMVNLVYALLKRMGSFLSRCCGCSCNFPFDCSTYAKAMNQGLQECGASFRMNQHMQCS